MIFPYRESASESVTGGAGVAPVGELAAAEGDGAEDPAGDCREAAGGDAPPQALTSSSITAKLCAVLS